MVLYSLLSLFKIKLHVLSCKKSHQEKKILGKNKNVQIYNLTRNSSKVYLAQ